MNMKPSPILTKKDGEPSIHLKQKAVFTGAIVAGVILVIVLGIVSSRKCNCESKKTGTTAPKSSSFSLGKTQTQMQPQTKGRVSEFQIGKSIINLTQEDLQKRLRLSKESQSGKDIQKAFREEVSKKLKREKFMATPKQVWKAPPGVQPGTLIAPPIGYERIPSTTNDRRPVDQPRPAAVYDNGDQTFKQTLYVNPDGSQSMGPQYSQTDNVLNGMMPPYKKENMVAEKLIMDERGATDHSFSESNNLEDGITGDTWEGDHQNWAVTKEETKKSMMKISDMFDSLLKDTIFPGLSKEEVGDGWFKIKSGTQCVSIERYYEWVSNTIAAQMGADPMNTMDWAKGSDIKLGFQFIDKSIPDLRQGLRWECDTAPSYKKQEDGTYISSQNQEEVAYTVIWPKDNSVLYVHRAMKK